MAPGGQDSPSRREMQERQDVRVSPMEGLCATAVSPFLVNFRRYTMRTIVGFCFTLIALGPLVAAAQEERELPSGQEVVDRFVEVTGGKERYQAVETITITGKIRMRELNSDGALEVFFKHPDKARLNVEVQGIGTIEKGNLGKVAWELNPAMGPRLLERDEARRFLEGINLKATYDPASIYESIENVGTEEVDGEPCYKLAMKRKGSDDVDYTFYSQKTGLAVKAVTQEPTVVGKITATAVLSEYKEVDGIKSAMKIVQELAGLGMTQEIEFESVKYNEPIDDAVFELPAEAKRLAEEAEKSE